MRETLPGSPKEPDPDGSVGADRPPIDERIQEVIGRSLRAHYDALLGEAVPDKFLVLLAELEAKEKRHGE